MGRSLFLLSALLLVGICNAALPFERYWHKVIPDSPMPEVIRGFLYPDLKNERAEVGKDPNLLFYRYYANEEGRIHDHPSDLKHEKASTVKVEKDPNLFFYTYYGDEEGQIHDHPSDLKHEKASIVKVEKDPNLFFYTYYGDEEGQIHDHPSDLKHEKASTVKVEKDPNLFFYTYYGDEEGQIHDHPSDLKHEKASTVKVEKDPNILFYYGDEEGQIHDHPSDLKHENSNAKKVGKELEDHDNPPLSYIFLEKDLLAKQKLNLSFINTPIPTILPRTKAEAIPFSSAKLPEILRHFSIEPESEDAMNMKNALKICESHAINGENRYCATSLESMLDFITSNLGTDIRVLATKAKETPKQQYMIIGAPHRVVASSSMTCHVMSYAYAVFLCHEIQDTKNYMVSLVGEDGSKVEAIVVCHEDTSAWNPNHQMLKLLKVKPGTAPVCHILPLNHIVWVPISTSQSI